MIFATIHVSDAYAKIITRKPIPAGVIGAQVCFEFDSSWDSRDKTVVFKSNITKDVIIDGDVVTIPAEVVSKPGVPLKVGVYGVASNNTALPTFWANLGVVLKATDPSGDTSTDPTPPIWAQIQSQIDELREHTLSSGLPDVTEDDNGKMLLVENNEWKLVPSTRFVKNKITISSFTANPSQAELGSTVSSVTLKWAVNMSPTELYLDDAVQDVEVVNLVDSTQRSANKTWTLKAVDDQGESAMKSASLSFLNGAYYGAAAQPESIDSAFLLGLSKTLTSTRDRTITVNAGADQHIWYAIPTRLGACKFSVGGFEGGFDLVDTFDFTNGSGYTESYYVYRSGQTSLGGTKVVIS